MNYSKMKKNEVVALAKQSASDVSALQQASIVEKNLNRGNALVIEKLKREIVNLQSKARDLSHEHSNVNAALCKKELGAAGMSITIAKLRKALCSQALSHRAFADAIEALTESA
jgi:hypothetical protein